MTAMHTNIPCSHLPPTRPESPTCSLRNATTRTHCITHRTSTPPPVSTSSHTAEAEMTSPPMRTSKKTQVCQSRLGAPRALTRSHATHHAIPTPRYRASRAHPTRRAASKRRALLWHHALPRSQPRHSIRPRHGQFLAMQQPQQQEHISKTTTHHDSVPSDCGGQWRR